MCLVVLSYFTIIARSRMETIPLPRPLESCLQEKNWYRPTLTDEEAIGSCLVDYMWNNNRKCKSVSKDTVTWFGELAVNRSNHLRLNPIPKERKEYRVLSDDERNDYHKAVNLLKNNKVSYMYVLWLGACRSNNGNHNQVKAECNRNRHFTTEVAGTAMVLTWYMHFRQNGRIQYRFYSAKPPSAIVAWVFWW